MENRLRVSSVPVADDFVILGEIPPPDRWEGGYSSSNGYLTLGLQVTIENVLKRKLNWKVHRNEHIEIRSPLPRYMHEVDSWHQDGMNMRQAFWFVLWNSAPMTEFRRLPEGYEYPHNGADLTNIPLEIVKVPENSIVALRNERFVHRRPEMTDEQVRNRWFARYFPSESSHAFNEVMNAYVYEQRFWNRPVAQTYAADSAPLSYATLLQAKREHERKKEEWLEQSRRTRNQFKHIY